MNRQQVLRNLAGSDMGRVLVAENQSVYDIIKLIKFKHGKTASDYDAISELFWKGDVYDTASGLWDFCKDNIKYSEESEAVQTVAQPKVILMKGKGDCKHYSLFIGGVLDSLNRKGYPIDWVYRFASYNPFDDTPGHVFVVIKDQVNDREIWVDPVLDSFDYHKPFSNAIDKKVSAKSATMSGIILPRSNSRLGLSAISGMSVLMDHAPMTAMGTTAQTGQMIMKVAPTLAVVPVVGWIAGAGAEVVGAFLSIFGNSYSTSDNVRWLTQKYQYYVLGDASATSNHHVNEANTANAQKWFSYVLGVPIFDQYRYHALRGTSPVTGKSLNITRQQRAQNYLNSAPDAVQAGVTIDQALAATYPADQFGENGIDGNFPPGSWKNFTAAPALIQSGSGTAPGTATQAGLFGDMPTWVMWVVGGALIFLLISGNKKHSHGKSKKRN